MAEEGYKPFFPKERREERGGLVVIREQMTPEMRKQRREDNKVVAKLRNQRNHAKHGTKTRISVGVGKPWIKDAKAKTKAKRKAKNENHAR